MAHHLRYLRIRKITKFGRAKGVVTLKRLVWTNLVLGVWLMISPFVLRLLYGRIFKVTWVDFIFGFSIGSISLARLFSHTSEEILITDWIVTTLGFLTLVNPLLYNYYGITLATVNNLLIGGVICFVAIYLDWKDSADEPLRSPPTGSERPADRSRQVPPK